MKTITGVRRRTEGGCTMDYTYRTKMVCAQQISPSGVCAVSIDFDIEDGKLHNVKFMGGCNGNLKAIAKLVDGWTVEQIEEKLKGNTCGMKPTSCADQLCMAVRTAYNELNS